MYKLVLIGALCIMLFLDLALAVQLYRHGMPTQMLFEQHGDSAKAIFVKTPVTIEDWVIGAVFVGLQVAIARILVNRHRKRPA
jgi:hypothetical protein